MQKTGSHSSMGELQKRYTERAKLRSEEKDLLQMIERTKAQLSQLQEEAVDIKSKIKPVQKNKSKNKTSKNNKITSDQQPAPDLDEDELGLNLGSTNDVLEKMLKGQFCATDVEKGASK